MSEIFVPLISPNAKTSEAVFTSFNLKPGLQSAKSSADTRPGDTASEACAKPTVTLQRNGDIVSSIRIQCGCGQIVELNCVY